MATTNTMPELDILFKGLGVTALKRGKRGEAALILKDTTPGAPKKFYRSIEDFDSSEQAKFTAESVKFIKDALEGIPLKLYVFKLDGDDVIADKLKIINGVIPRNCWIGTPETTYVSDLVSWIKAKRKNDKKRYKMIGHNLSSPDDMGIVNFANDKVTFSDERGEVSGIQAVPYLLGFLAGISLNMSAIAFELGKFSSVSEPEDLDTEIKNGKFLLFNDEGVVKVARAVNSLVTLGQDIILEMTHINTVEKMDLIYCDIHYAWNQSYKGKYPNLTENQMLLISAINSYFKGLAIDYVLDPNFDNRAFVDLEQQRLANYPKYGEEEVQSWDDEKVRNMTVGTKVFLKANIKISGIMEDFYFNIFL